MGDGLLGGQLPQLVEQDVQLELGAEVAETAEAEGLERPVGDERAQQVHVRHELGEDGVLEVLPLALGVVDVEDALLQLDLVA